jgi:hypothetical protein
VLLLLAVIGCDGSDEEERTPELSTSAPHNVPAVPAAAPASTLSSRLASHIDSLVNAGGSRSRVVFTSGNQWSVEYIRRRFAESGAAVAIDSFGVRCSDGRTRSLSNVIATIPGADDSLVVVCAHLDASASRDRGWARRFASMPAPGADDNASGVSALVEILGSVRRSNRKPAHTLMIVACNAEEKNPRYGGHHLGSRHVAERLKQEGAAVAAVISIDMAGYSPRGREIGLFASGRGQQLARRLSELKSSMKLDLGLPRSVAPCRNSDNESFERAGYPTVLFMESCKPWRGSAQVPRNPGYHSSRDLPGLVNVEVLAAVTSLVAELMLEEEFTTETQR